MGSVLVVGSLIAVCGFIAYTGDLLGRRMGKRRLSIWGLRPRHTAILCTVLTGMVIAGTTLGVLMLASAGVRVAVIRGEALLHQNREYRSQRDALRHEAWTLRQEIGPMRQENQELDDRNRQLMTNHQRLSRYNEQLAAKVERLRHSEKKLTAEKERLIRATGDAEASLRSTRADKEAAERELKVVAGQLQLAKQHLEANRRLMGELRERMEDSSFTAARLALSDVVVRDQEELARVAVAAGTPVRQVEAQVWELLARSREEAQERGARPRSAHGDAAYLVYGPLARALGPTVEGPTFNERDLVRLIARGVAESGGDVVLRAQAVQNTVRDEPVPVDIQLFWNVRAFHKGEEIASTTIQPSQTRGQILEQLAAFLQINVRKASIARKMIPGPQNNLGEVRYDPLLEVADKVKGLGVPARVGVVAARDVRSADPLVLDFYVVPAETAVAARTTQVADESR
jgi:uncharacterized protein (DUF3084 family)